MTYKRALLFTGGPSPVGLDQLPEFDLVIAADRGADHAITHGLGVDLLVGDMDSVSLEALDACRETIQHPVDKDETDLELSLEAAVQSGVKAITVIASNAGRLDHSLGNLLAMASDRWSSLEIDALVDENRLYVVRDNIHLKGLVGNLVSLLAIAGPATGVSTTGLHWALHDARLEEGSGLGLSNKFAQANASITVGTGVIFVILPIEKGP